MENEPIDVKYIEACLYDIERASKELREKLKQIDSRSAEMAQEILDDAVKNVDWILNKKGVTNVSF